MVWSIPALTIILLGGVAWIGSHQLDPAAPGRGHRASRCTIQAVSLDWKWLFIYPDQRIATVNTLTVPVGAPLHFELTSASVMNVFFIPQLGSMIYTMNGMVTRLNLRADNDGQLSGPVGAFQRRRLSRHACSTFTSCRSRDFASWARQHRAAATGARTRTAIKKICQSSRSERARPSTGSTIPRLFHAIATQKIPPAAGPRNPA